MTEDEAKGKGMTPRELKGQAWRRYNVTKGTESATFAIAAALAALAEQQEATAKAQADTARALERIAEALRPTVIAGELSKPMPAPFRGFDHPMDYAGPQSPRRGTAGAV